MLVDKDLLLSKASSVRRHLKRAKEKAEPDLTTFLADLDRQEIVMFNIHMAIQNCIDIAAHIISEEGFGIPDSTGEMFNILEENNYLSNELTQKMVKAAGLRNLIVHEYAKIEAKQVFSIVKKDIGDLNAYLQAIFKKANIST